MPKHRLQSGLIVWPTVASAALLLAPDAWAQSCEARFAGVANLTFQARSYDVYRRDDLTGNGQIEVVRTGDAPCRIAVVLKSKSTGQRELGGTAGNIVYSIRRDEADGITLNNIDRPAANGTLTAILAERTSVTFPLTLRIPAEQIVPAGRYRDTVTAYLFDTDDLRQLDRRTFTPSVVVDARTDVSVSTTASRFDIAQTFATLDLGELQTGERARAYVTVRSTSDYLVSLASENGSRLRRDGGEQSIEYDATLNGRSIKLGRTMQTVDRSAGPTPSDGRSYSFEVRIGNVGRKRAGIYSDRVRIRVEPID